MISVEDARRTILEAITPLPGADTVPVEEATGRVSSAEILAAMELPPFDNAAVDGYAVRSLDLKGASPSSPKALAQLGTVAAGEAPNVTVNPGGCARIFTGAVLPAGADAVVMQEDTVTNGSETVQFLASAGPWEGVRLAGEDLRRGTRLVACGDRLRPAQIGLLASTGHASLAVYRQPRIAVLSTGNELVAPGTALTPGRIYNSNFALLHALARAEGIPDIEHSQSPDDLDGTMTALRNAARSSDVVVTTGGVSVGDRDLVKAAFAALGGTVEIWRLAMKPGKPFAWGRLENVLWFGLPGNPVSAYVTWWVLVRPALRRLMGMRDPLSRCVKARLGEPIANPGDRRHFMRVRLDAESRVWSAGVQASHIQSSLSAANALLDAPPGVSWETGREVSVELLDG